MPVLHLMVGLPCSGKTTLAKKLEAELGALRLTADDWHRHIFGQDATHPEHDDRHARIEALQWQVASDALARGLDVILDFGLWAREEREDFYARAEALGARPVLHYLDVPHNELLRRLDVRNAEASGEATWIPRPMMEAWLPHFEAPNAEELDSRGA